MSCITQLVIYMAGVGSRFKASWMGRDTQNGSGRRNSLPLKEEPTADDLSDVSSLKDSSSFILQPSLHGMLNT